MNTLTTKALDRSRNRMLPVMLTTDHAASGYGMPVLVVDDTPHGPDDALPIGYRDATAKDLVQRLQYGFIPPEHAHTRYTEQETPPKENEAIKQLIAKFVD